MKKKIFKEQTLCLLLVLSIIFSQVIGLSVFKVKAAEGDFSVQVVVQSSKGVLADEIMTISANDTKASKAMISALEKHGITDYVIAGGFITSINNIANAADFTSYWMYQVKRNNNYVNPMAGIEDFQLQNGDKLIVYYSGTDTLSADKISYSTNLSNTPLTITLEGTHWSGSIKPISNIKAKVYHKDSSNKEVVVFDKTISDNKINISEGLPEGTYTLELSDFKENGMPNVVADSFTFTISAAPQENNKPADSTPSNNPYDRDNTQVTKNIEAELNSTLNYVKNNMKEDPWALISLNKMGIKPNTTFIKQSAADVKKSKGVKDFTNTELEKLIMALAASGYTPYNFMGYDLVAELYNRDINNFLINDAIYALIAMNLSLIHI